MFGEHAERDCFEQYLSILSRINSDPIVTGLMSGRIKMPLFTYDAPFNPVFGFPPAIIPILSTGGLPGYIGLVHHWFGNAPGTFVKYYAEQSAIVEIAKTAQQLRYWLVFECLRNVPEPNEVAEFARSVGFSSMVEVERLFGGCEEVRDLASLEAFVDAPAILKSRGGRPSWVKEADLFDSFLEDGDLEKAWYALNGPGVDIRATAQRLGKLLLLAPAADFEQLVDAWMHCNFGQM